MLSASPWTAPPLSEVSQAKPPARDQSRGGVPPSLLDKGNLMAQTAPKKAARKPPRNFMQEIDDTATVREVVDSRGNVRVYTDVPRAIAKEFAILAIRRGKSKRALMADLIMRAVAGA